MAWLLALTVYGVTGDAVTKFAALSADIQLAVALLAMLTLWQSAAIAASVTMVDDTGITQRFGTTTRVRWADVTQGRLIALRGHEQWFAARLILQVGEPGRRVFRLGDRHLVDAVLRIGPPEVARETGDSSTARATTSKD